MPLDPQAKVLIELVDSVGLGNLTPDTDPQVIRDLMTMVTLPSPIVVEHVEDRTIPGPADDIPVRVYRPSGPTPKPVLVFLHGGGWVYGDLNTHDGMCRLLADAVGCVIVSVEYRLAPEHRFPAAPDDSFAATRWVYEHADELGGDPARIAVGGDSAGGNLAALVAQQARAEGGPPLVFQLLIYPVTDLTCTRPSMTENASGYFLTTESVRWFGDHYLGPDGDRADPRVSPLLAEDLSNLPPALVITAEFDPLRDQGNAYGEALAAAGNRTEIRCYDGMFHGFFGNQALVEAAKGAFDDAVAALRGAFGET